MGSFAPRVAERVRPESEAPHWHKTLTSRSQTRPSLSFQSQQKAARGMTCNCVSPGYVWTPLIEHQKPDTMKARHQSREQIINDVLLHSQPTMQFVIPEQAAATAILLCSDAAAQIRVEYTPWMVGWVAE
jgi:NAD(P)-dependent dehydrogenase (short-subunit alcohol dehydrogenase family)